MNASSAFLTYRFAAILVWGAILFWLPVEDQTTFAAQMFGLLLAGLLGLRQGLRWGGSTMPRAALTGLAAGAAVGPLAAGLMIVKSGLHSHGLPDFSIEDISLALARTPVFALAGLLMAVGLQRVRQHAA